MDLTQLLTHPRLLIEVALRPVAGTRFQPTGFPDLGAATYTAADGTPMLLVESAQSMANRLETVCWDEAEAQVVPALAGLPYVEAELPDGVKTNSLLEAHRLNSPYLVNSDGFAKIREAIGFKADAPFDRQKLVQALFKYDPNSLLHGIFLEKVGGVVRLPRALTAFIEAREARVAASGGVKVDRVQPATGGDTPYGEAKDGYGNVPYQRDEYAGEITAFFNLDLSLIAGFRLPNEARELLIALALFKVQRFLASGLRLRTACDLEPVDESGELKAKRPRDFTLPPADAVAKRLAELLAHKAMNFTEPRITTLRYEKGKAAKKGEGRNEARRRAAALIFARCFRSCSASPPAGATTLRLGAPMPMKACPSGPLRRGVCSARSSPRRAGKRARPKMARPARRCRGCAG